jgi:hypothetical protein
VVLLAAGSVWWEDYEAVAALLAGRKRLDGMDAVTTGLVEPYDGGSRFTMRVELRPHALSHLLAPLALWLMARQGVRNMARIRSALEP